MKSRKFLSMNRKERSRLFGSNLYEARKNLTDYRKSIEDDPTSLARYIKSGAYGNKFDGYDGIMVQLPVPKQISVEKINMTLDPKKDVDGFTKTSECDPCTPLGILKFLENMKVEFSGKNAVVIGRSEIVGKPMAKMLLDKNCTVTVCHSKTPKEELKRYVENDLLKKYLKYPNF